ncbi:MAG: FixH family protein [Hydrogenimonas sp.]|nr:FixH family protein [Hydrogenimonas sp.]
MKISALLLSIALAFTSLNAAAYEKSLKHKSIKVKLSSEKPLTAGTNHIKLKLYKSSKPLDGAKVALKIFMPAMPGMPYMESRAKAKSLGNGIYEATFNAAMGGTWQVYIFVTTKEGKKYRLKTSFNL